MTEGLEFSCPPADPKQARRASRLSSLGGCHTDPCRNGCILPCPMQGPPHASHPVVVTSPPQPSDGSLPQPRMCPSCVPQAKQPRIKFPEVHGPPASPKPLQPSLPLQIPQPHRPFTLTPKPSTASRERPKPESYPPTPFHCPTMQLENHGQLLDNCCHLPARLHPPQPPSFQTSSSRLTHAQDPFLPHLPYPHSFYASFWANMGELNFSSCFLGLSFQPQVSADLEFIRDHPQKVCWSLLHTRAGHSSDTKPAPSPC